MENNTRTGKEETKLEALRREAVALLVQLTDEELMRVLSPFAEEYGWQL